MNIKPFKGRTIDPTKRVKVYRNLAAKTDDEKFSILQGGLVVAHTNCILLKNCRLFVNQRGRERVVATKRKRVHAFIIGTLGNAVEWMTEIPFDGSLRYNPYENRTFMATMACNPVPYPANCARFVLIRPSDIRVTEARYLP